MTAAAEDDSSVVAQNAPPIRIRTMFARFWPDTRPFRGRMLLSLLLVPVGPALATGSVYLFKVLVDDVLTPHDYQLFLPIALAYVGFAVVGGLVSFIDEYLTAWVGESFVTSLRVRLFAHLQRLSVGWFERRQVGDLISRLTGDIATIEQLVLTGVNLALTYAFQVVFFAGAMFLLNWHLTLTAFVAAPAFLLLSRAFSRRIQDASRERRRRSGSITAVAEENLGNIPLVQAYDRADHEVERFAAENRAAFSAQMLAIRLEALFGPFSSIVECIGVLAVTGVAVYELAQGAITLGGLLAFLAYLSQLYGPVQGFAGLSNTLFAASAGAERIIEVLDEQPAVAEPLAPHALGRASGAIRFEKVWFTYDGTERPALRGVDLRLTPGRKVAIVGASGAGKSTITKLLLRSYDPGQGRVTLDGLDLRELSLTDLRRNISTVLQETLVFDGTVAENIRWGKPDATDAEVRAAARAADADGFIARLDHGYDTRVGQRGRLLSGGQRQRLAIARAIIRDAPVLLLDEPTTGLDAASGQRVLAPLRRLMAGRTTIIISHDLHTVTDADEIVVLEAGAVSAVGRHEELLATSPVYAHLYALHHPANRTVAVAPPRRMPAPAAPPPARPRPQRPRGVLAAMVDVATTPVRMVPSAASARSRATSPPRVATAPPSTAAGLRPPRSPAFAAPPVPPAAGGPADPRTGLRASAACSPTATAAGPWDSPPRLRPPVAAPPPSPAVVPPRVSSLAAATPPPASAVVPSGFSPVAAPLPTSPAVVPSGPAPVAASTPPPYPSAVSSGVPVAAAPPPAPAAAPGAPPVTATTPLPATRGRHASPQSLPDAPASQRPPRHALAEAAPPVPPTRPLRAIGSAPVTAPGLAHQLPGPRAPHDVPS